jgi:hypothetical protein
MYSSAPTFAPTPYHPPIGEGGGGNTSAYADNQLFVRGPPQFQIFCAETGAQVATFPRSHIPAFSAQTGFFNSNGTLAAIDQTSQNTLWTFTGAGGLISTSIAIDPTGDHRLLLRDCVCPQCDSWQRAVEGFCRRPDQWSRSTNVTQPLTGLGAGEGYLVVPAGTVLSVRRVIP